MKNDNEDKKSLGNMLVTETILIGLTTAVAYISYAFYQRSYLHYYGIPSYFLEFDLVKMLFTFAILLASLIIIFILISPLMTVLAHGELKCWRDKWKIILYYIPLIFVCVLQYDLEKSKIENMWALFFIGIVWTALIYILNKENKNKDLPGEQQKIKFLVKIREKYGRLPFVLLAVGVVFVISSIVAGNNVAKWQEEYLVIDREAPLAIIKSYSDGFVAIAVNKQSRTFSDKIYYISKLDMSAKQLIAVREHIGPLRNGGDYIEDDIFTTFGRELSTYLTNKKKQYTNTN